MTTHRTTHRLQIAFTIVIGSVWVFHGLYSKILMGIPRHRDIVARVLGEDIAGLATYAIGFLEILLGLWAYSRWNRMGCALVQTLALVSMNVLEIALARDLLISAAGMAVLNLAFLTLVWHWALFPRPWPIRR
jgi:hypothetical protein